MTHDDARAILPGPGDLKDLVEGVGLRITDQQAMQLTESIADFMADLNTDPDDEDDEDEDLGNDDELDDDEDDEDEVDRA